MRLRGPRHPSPEEMYLEVVLAFICSYLHMLLLLISNDEASALPSGATVKIDSLPACRVLTGYCGVF
jgi:hypothetical protein